jgi:hypothetical protein
LNFPLIASVLNMLGKTPINPVSPPEGLEVKQRACSAAVRGCEFQHRPGACAFCSTKHLLAATINAGALWRDTAATAFGGQGSMGNGGAMHCSAFGRPALHSAGLARKS